MTPITLSRQNWLVRLASFAGDFSPDDPRDQNICSLMRALFGTFMIAVFAIAIGISFGVVTFLPLGILIGWFIAGLQWGFIWDNDVLVINIIVWGAASLAVFVLLAKNVSKNETYQVMKVGVRSTWHSFCVPIHFK